MILSIRVLIVSDNLLSRVGLAAMLEGHDALEIVGQIDSASLLETIDIYDAQIILFDLGWQATQHLSLLGQLPSLNLPIVILVADEQATANLYNVLARYSAYGLLHHANDETLLAQALVTVTNGLIVIDPKLVSQMMPSSHTVQIEALTPRENQVLQLLARGLTNKAIAQQLGITDHTVKFHVNAIMTKMNAQSRTEAVVIATRAGLIIL